MLLWICILSSVLIFKFLLHIINKYDKEISPLKPNYLIIFTVFFLTDYLIYIQYGNLVDFFIIASLCIFMYLTSYIDYMIQNIYIFPCLIFYILGLLFVISRNIIAIPSFLVYGFVLYLCCKINLFGGGDGYYIAAIAPYLIISKHFMPIEAILTHFALSVLIFFISNIRHYDKSNKKMEYAIAFAPSISVSFLILMLF